MTGRPVKLVLDTTASLAYPGDDIGELIAEVADEGGMVGLPVACFAAALARTVDQHWLRLLAKHTHCRVVDLCAADADSLGRLLRLLGRFDCASAMVVARSHRAYVVTAEPEAYDDGSDGWDLPVIGV